MDTTSALHELELSQAALHDAQRRLEASVLSAREAGATWAQVGQATGMSRQAAHERWGHVPRGGCQRASCDCPHHAAHDCPCGHGPGRGYRAKADAAG